MKLFFYFLLFVFTVSNSIAKILPTLLVETEDKSKKLNQYVQKDSVFTEKDFIKQLFSLPVEYHQYVMPMVAEMPAISEKTRTMPGIVEWRRKLPQKVPLQLEDYAAENLKYLNPAYYPLLIPEAWDEAHGYEHNYNDKLPSNALDISTPKKMEATFPSYIDPKDNILDMMQFTPKLTDNNKLEKITSQNVASVFDIV